MKIAILGTRGVPNNYGGPETNAEFMSPIFRKYGHEVTIYNPDEHPYQQAEWNGIRIKHVYCQESRFGIWGTLLYDFLCLKDAMAADYDIVLELGYVPCALFFPFFRNRRTRIVTNMDGLEWKRSKWNYLLQKFAKFTEYLGARYSDALIADNVAIQAYLKAEHGKPSYYIPYGAQHVEASDPAHLARYDVRADAYYMLIARMEPENNIEMILDGYVAAKTPLPMLVIGKTTTLFGRRMRAKFGDAPGIRFLEGIYDYAVLSSLRWHARCYFHGHSVGGTNPSLVEAMASHAFLAVHDNVFNRAVVNDDALFFGSADDVAAIIAGKLYGDREVFINRNLRKIEAVYNWDNSAKQHLAAFEEILAKA